MKIKLLAAAATLALILIFVLLAFLLITQPVGFFFVFVGLIVFLYLFFGIIYPIYNAFYRLFLDILNEEENLKREQRIYE